MLAISVTKAATTPSAEDGEEGQGHFVPGSHCTNYGDWVYSISQIIDLRVKVLTIKQESKESLASAWNRFTTLLAFGPDHSLPDPILLQHFYKDLSIESRKLLDTTLGGSFLHVSSEKARLILDQILSIELDYL